MNNPPSTFPPVSPSESGAPRTGITGPRPSWKRRAARRLILVLAVYAFVEVAALAALYLLEGGWSTVRRQRRNAVGAEAVRLQESIDKEVIHPYLGFVLDRENLRPSPPFMTAVNDFGFDDNISPVQRREPGKAIIGILGGSVAYRFSFFGLQVLSQELKKTPRFADKELLFVRMALSGYKQPQQLMAVSYLLSQGAEFDALINIDGFNEVCLPVIENIPNGVFTSFPRSWHRQAADEDNASMVRLWERVAFHRHARCDWAALFESTPLQYSPLANLIWKLHDNQLSQALLEDRQSYHQAAKPGNGFRASGPGQEFTDADATYDHITAVWENCSLQMHRLCAGNGIDYFHFLQPNQYLPGSKTMGPAELLEAIKENDFHVACVRSGYPLLRKKGEALAKRGVRFHDLTRMFADHPEQTYADTMCHLNEHGNEIMARVIARHIRGDLAEEPATDPAERDFPGGGVRN